MEEQQYIGVLPKIEGKLLAKVSSQMRGFKAFTKTFVFLTIWGKNNKACCRRELLKCHKQNCLKLWSGLLATLNRLDIRKMHNWSQNRSLLAWYWHDSYQNSVRSHSIYQWFYPLPDMLMSPIWSCMCLNEKIKLQTRKIYVLTLF